MSAPSASSLSLSTTMVSSAVQPSKGVNPMVVTRTPRVIFFSSPALLKALGSMAVTKLSCEPIVPRPLAGSVVN